MVAQIPQLCQFLSILSLSFLPTLDLSAWNRFNYFVRSFPLLFHLFSGRSFEFSPLVLEWYTAIQFDLLSIRMYRDLSKSIRRGFNQCYIVIEYIECIKIHFFG